MLDKALQLDESLRKTIRRFKKMDMVRHYPIESAVREIEEWIDEDLEAEPPLNRANQAAIKFLRHQQLDSDDLDFISAVIASPIEGFDEKRVIDDSRFSKEILSPYDQQVVNEDFWGMSWNWLLKSYFGIDSSSLKTSISKKNFKRLQRFLQSSHHLFTKNNPLGWAKALSKNLEVISNQPCKKYAKAVFAGNHSVVNELKEKLGIPQHSWFWVQLTHDVVISVTEESNHDVFKSQLPHLIQYLKKHQAIRDRSIKLILERYYRCLNKARNKELSDFVISDGGWGTPKLRNANITSKWKLVEEPVWKMVRSWVNAENLRIFIKELSARNGKEADKGRFEFWVKYADQMNIKFAFGKHTLYQKKRNKVIAKLLAEEAETSANLTGNNASDAIIMQIAQYTIVEFSTHGTAAFIYKSNDLPFDFGSRGLNDRTWGNGLKAARERAKRKSPILKLGGFKRYANGDCIITHRTQKTGNPYIWHDDVKQGLMHLGIYPDA